MTSVLLLERLTRIFGSAFGTVISMQAAIMKRPRFVFEDEWRLMVHYSGQFKQIGPGGSTSLRG